MTAVADASPLITLARLGVLHILPLLFHPVRAPSPVYDEVVTVGLVAGHTDAHAVQLEVVRGAITIVAMEESDLSPAVRALGLGRGESFAIQMALQESADVVLLDDLRARHAATDLNLSVKGTVGVIAGACRGGHLTPRERDFLFDAMLHRDDIWINASVVRRVWQTLRDEEG